MTCHFHIKNNFKEEESNDETSFLWHRNNNYSYLIYSIIQIICILLGVRFFSFNPYLKYDHYKYI